MTYRTLAAILFCLFLANIAASQKIMPSIEHITIKHIAEDFSIDGLDHPEWKKAVAVKVGTYWSGESAPQGRAFEARLLWSDAALYVRFDASQDEPLIVSKDPDVSTKTWQLWDRDVCEIFIAPVKTKRNKYFEFEIAPTGEWIDLGIEVTSQGLKTDKGYSSGMTSAARVEATRVVMAMRIPFASLGGMPKKGDVWLGNLLRCVGKDPTRGYLAWQPTRTPTPNFHVPEAFGEFRFAK